MNDRPVPYSDEELAVIRRRAKAALRQKLRGVRGSLPEDAVRRRSEAICARVMALPAWSRARTVSLFAALSHEVQLDALFDDARRRGVTVVVPRVEDHTRAMTFGVCVTEGREIAMQRSAFGVLEPAPDAPLVAPSAVDLVVVPALAVDPAGQRLGYGRAHYDNTLPQATRALHVAVAFDFQLIAEVPAEPHDVPVHVVVTDARTVVVSDGPPPEDP